MVGDVCLHVQGRCSEFLGVTSGVEFLLLVEFCTVGYLCAREREREEKCI